MKTIAQEEFEEFVYETASYCSSPLTLASEVVKWVDKFGCDDPTPSDGWISVKDRLPDTEDDFLVTDHRGDMEVSIFGMKEQAFLFFDGHGYAHKRTMVTHWMPLPRAPKEKPDEKENRPDA